MVVDASVAASWFLRNQATQRADDLLTERDRHDFVAPIYFAVELRNLLLVGERRGALTTAMVEDNLLRAEVLISIEHGDVEEEAQAAMATGRAYGLTLYDAIYLTKALREGRGLASRDRQLLAAATAAGIKIYDARDQEPA